MVDRPVWVFANQYDGSANPNWIHPDIPDPNNSSIIAPWGPVQEYMGLVGSHEVGHGFGLAHDGVNHLQAVPEYLAGSSQYYAGHTTGATDAATSWGAIMGGSELRSLTQWSMGEYAGATNTSQDDLSIIAGHLGYREDDHGGTITNDVLNPTDATVLTLVDNFVTASGIIERSSSTINDYDVFEINFDGAPAKATIRIDTPPPAIVKDGAGVGVDGNFVGVSNLDVEMRIYEEGDLSSPMHTTMSDDATNALYTIESPSGIYYVVVDGVGYVPGIGADYGYSDYGSLGQYTLTAAVTPDLFYVTTEVDQVDSNNDERWISLREAIMAANDASGAAYIHVPRGHYTLDLTDTEQGNARYNDLDVTGDVRIFGEGAGLTVIDNSGLGSSNYRSFDVAAGGANLELSRLTIANSSTYFDPGLAVRVLADSSLTVNDGAIANHLVNSPVTAVDGAAIYSAGGDVTIRRSVFTGNETTTGSGAAVAVVGGGADAPKVTIGESIFALNDDYNSHPNVYIGFSPGPNDLLNEGYNLYDDKSGGFFDATTAAGDHEGTADYVVTTVADTFYHDDNEYSLSLREAVALANDNDNTPEEIWLPAWTYYLTRRNGDPNAADHDIEFGDLDIFDTVTIRGAGASNVQVIQQVAAYQDFDAVFDLVGDFDESTFVDQSDISDWYANYQGPYDSQWDANDDGTINMEDYDAWVANIWERLTLVNVVGV